MSATECPGGACWLHLDGHKACVTPTASPQLEMCFGDASFCCQKDADCAQPGPHGRCLPHQAEAVNFCGGAIPFGNVCSHDDCINDSECIPNKPAGATVAMCLPAGALVDRGNSDHHSLYNTTCAYGACRTDADCTLHPGGRCQYGLAATGGMCSLTSVFFCAYPSDPCQVSANFTSTATCYCTPNANDQGQQCGKAPPAYP